MNRTVIFLGVAAALALVAVVAKVPRGRGVEPSPHVQPPTVRVPPAVNPTVTSGSLTMTSRLSHPYVGRGSSDVFVTVDLRGMELPGTKRAPVNLALVLDRSGSMSGFKLNQAKQAARQLIAQLGEQDHLAIVHYGSDVKSLDGLFCTEANKGRLLAYVDGIWDEGGTNIGQGLSVGRDLLVRSMSDFKVNRLVLISDGQPTEGMTDHAALTDVVRQTRAQGISISSIGVGDDFNEQLMEAFAELGGGAYAYLQDVSQLGSIFQKDLNAAGTQVAKAVSLTFRVPQGARLEQVLGYTNVLRTAGAEETVRVALPDFAAGQSERVVVHLRLDAAAIGQAVDVAGVTLDYADVVTNKDVRSEAALSAFVTDSQETVASNQDKDAIVFAARARSADNLRQAAGYLRAGRKAEAQKLVEQNAFFFEEAAKVSGAGAVEEDLAYQRSASEALRQADDEGATNQWSKQNRKKARVDFGLMGSTY